MYRVGYSEIPWRQNITKKPRCFSCGERARKIVTFRDTWVTVRVQLCNNCAMLPYDELNLQQTIMFPGVA